MKYFQKRIWLPLWPGREWWVLIEFEHDGRLLRSQYVPPFFASVYFYTANVPDWMDAAAPGIQILVGFGRWRLEIDAGKHDIKRRGCL